MNVITPSTRIEPFGVVLLAAALILAGCGPMKTKLHKLDPGTDEQAQTHSPFYHALSIGTVTVDEVSNPISTLLETVLPEEMQHAVEDVLRSANLLSASDPGTFILDVRFLYGEQVFVAGGLVGNTRINTLFSYSITDRVSGESVFTETIAASYESSGTGDGMAFMSRLETAFQQSIRRNLADFVGRVLALPQ